MSTAPRGPVAAFLLRAVFPVAALAIIAGLLGMHVVAGGPSAHAGHSASTGHSVSAGHAGHPGHSAHAWYSAHHTGFPPSAEGSPLSAGASSCAVTGDCPAMSGTGAGCVLAPGTAPLTAPLPGAVLSALPQHGPSRAGASFHYSYKPGSPSPGDLCISRT